MKKYDFLIVGSGLFGATFAYRAKKDGKSCLVIDRRKELGGNVFCQEKYGIITHKYGCHIFHTNKRNIWDFVNRFVEFVPFILSPIANYKGELYNLPFNMNTFVQMWNDVQTPYDAKKRISEQIGHFDNPKNLEEQAINLVGKDVFNKLIKGYTEKQWGKACNELPASIIKRIPVRFTFNNNYFNDIYQGIPRHGYNVLINGLLEGIDKLTCCDFIKDKDYFMSIAKKVIYTGPIDELFNYELGMLEYRTLNFEEEVIEMPNYQGCAVMNFTSIDEPYTRIIEHKHFDRWCNNDQSTIITKEYSKKWGIGCEPYYPINDDINDNLYQNYSSLSKAIYGDKIIYGGRLGVYKYLDMDKTIESAINLYNKIKY